MLYGLATARMITTRRRDLEEKNGERQAEKGEKSQHSKREGILSRYALGPYSARNVRGGGSASLLALVVLPFVYLYFPLPAPCAGQVPQPLFCMAVVTTKRTSFAPSRIQHFTYFVHVNTTYNVSFRGGERFPSPCPFLFLFFFCSPFSMIFVPNLIPKRAACHIPDPSCYR